MAQEFQARFIHEGDAVDLTPAGDTDAGAVVLRGSKLVTIAKRDIEAAALGAVATKGVYDIVIKNESLTDGDAIYWDADGDPYNGEAGTGAATATGSAGPFIGWCLEDAVGGTDEKVRAQLRSMESAAAESLGLTDLTDITSPVTYDIGKLLVADGDSFESVAPSGAITIIADGTVTINPDTVLGASGTAGSLDIFPSTAASGNAAISVTDQGADHEVGVVIGAMAQATVVTLDDPGTDASFVTDEGAQTIGGVKTFTLMPIIPTATVAATGNSQGTAAAVVTGFTLVTGADATKAVVLPTAVAGLQVEIKNEDSANATLDIFPASSDAINAIAADSALTIAAKTAVRLVALDATTWYSLPLLPS
jgi:predicted RecA/RadA family phage recombinase